MTDGQCKFLHKPLFGEEVSVLVDFADVKTWKATKRQASTLIPKDVAMSRLAWKTPSWVAEQMKTYTQQVVNKTFLDKLPEVELQFSLFPCAVHTATKIKKNDLQLYPVGTIQPVKDSESHKLRGIPVQYKGAKFQIMPPRALSSLEEDVPGTLVPFHCLSQTEDESEVNMQLKWMTVKGVSIPSFINSASLAANATLCIVKQPWEFPGSTASVSTPVKKRKTN